MRINKSVLSDTEIKLTITADADFMARVKDHVLRHMTREVKIPGFRPGKAPQALAEKQIDPNLLQSEFLDEALNRLYSEAIKAENIRPIANPQVAMKKFVPFTDLEFDVTVEVIGEIKLASYKKAKSASKPNPVIADDVNAIIATLQTRLSDRKEVVRAAKNGDEVIMDFTGKDKKGEPVNGADAKDYPLIIGSNALIPGFEPNLVGLKAGDKKSFEVTFPADYQAAQLANQKVTFDVVIHKVNELIEPKIDDEFAAKAGPFKTLKELKDDIKKQLSFERENETRKTFENELVNEIVSKSKVAVPKALVDDQIVRNEDEERKNLTFRGQTWQEHLESEGVTEEQHRERQRQPSEETIKTSIVLSEIAMLEKISVSNDEVDIRIKLLEGQYTDPTMREELHNPENRRNIEARLMTEKTIDKLVEYADKS